MIAIAVADIRCYASAPRGGRLSFIEPKKNEARYLVLPCPLSHGQEWMSSLNEGA